MTLYEIGIIAWHYTTPLPFPQEDAPLYKPTIDGFVEAGLMTESKRITDLGEEYLKMLQKVPLLSGSYLKVKYTPPIGETDDIP